MENKTPPKSRVSHQKTASNGKQPPGQCSIEHQAQSAPDDNGLEQGTALSQFSFVEVDSAFIPQIYRTVNGTRVTFVVVWMTELKILWRFPSAYPDRLIKRSPLKSFTMTDHEVALVDDINRVHCLHEFGSQDARLRAKQLVKFDDFVDLYQDVRSCFPDIAACRAVGVSLDQISRIKGGFVQINNTICPYVVRAGVRLLPYSYLEHTGFHPRLQAGGMYGYLPSPGESAFLNSLSPRLNLRVKIGMLCRLVALDMLMHLADCTVRELKSEHPYSSAVYNASCEVQPHPAQTPRNIIAGPGHSPEQPLLESGRGGGQSQRGSRRSGRGAAGQGGERSGAGHRAGRSRSQVGGPGRGRTVEAAAAASSRPPQQSQQLAQRPPTPPLQSQPGLPSMQSPHATFYHQAGTCSMVQFPSGQSQPSSTCTLMLMRPMPIHLPLGAPQGDFVSLGHLRQTCFAHWPSGRLLWELQFSCQPPIYPWPMSASLVAMHEEASRAALPQPAADQLMVNADALAFQLPHLLQNYTLSLTSENRLPAPTTLARKEMPSAQLQQEVPPRQQAGRLLID